MVDGFMDTNIAVDFLRDYPPAAAWLQQPKRLAVTPIVWLEVVDGVQNKQKQIEALKLLKNFQMIYLVPQDFDWAMQHAVKFKLSHNVRMMDCLIASVSARLQLPLYTNNLKHFAPMLGTLAQRPY